MESHAVFLPENGCGSQFEFDPEDIKPILPEALLNEGSHGLNSLNDLGDQSKHNGDGHFEPLIKIEPNFDENESDPLVDYSISIKVENCDEIIDFLEIKHDPSVKSKLPKKTKRKKLSVGTKTKYLRKKNALRRHNEPEEVRQKRLEKNKIKVRMHREKKKQRLSELQTIIQDMECASNVQDNSDGSVSSNLKTSDKSDEKKNVLQNLKLEAQALLEKKKRLVEYVYSRRNNESKEKREERLEKIRIRARERRSQRAEEKNMRAQRLLQIQIVIGQLEREKDNSEKPVESENYRESPEQRAEKLEILKNLKFKEQFFLDKALEEKKRAAEYIKDRRNNETPEKREERLAKERNRSREKRSMKLDKNIEKQKINIKLRREKERQRFLEIQTLIKTLEEESNLLGDADEAVESENAGENRTERDQRMELLNNLKLEEQIFLDKRKRVVEKASVKRSMETPEQRERRLEKARIRAREKRQQKSKKEKVVKN